MDGTDGELLLVALLADAFEFLALLDRDSGFLAGIVLVDGVDADKGAVEESDDGGIGERTRSHGECPASAAASVDSAVHREQEDGPLMFFAQLDRGANVLRPADLVK